MVRMRLAQRGGSLRAFTARDGSPAKSKCARSRRVFSRSFNFSRRSGWPSPEARPAALSLKAGARGEAIHRATRARDAVAFRKRMDWSLLEPGRLERP